jgi:DHA1 family bicyclomycin/chloramphenicol resistance-like MFS transporter
MLRPDSLAFTLLLSFLMSFGPLSIDLFLPSMPEIGRALGAPAAQLQLTISLYLVAFAIGQVIYGPLSDRVGRVPVLLAAFAIFCAASVLCRFAPNMEALVIGRVFQGLGASAAPVVVRAIVRDLHEGVHAGRQLSLMMTFTGLVPIAAPLLGGALLTFFGWRSGFVFQFAAGALAFFLVYRCVVRMPPPEASTLPVLIGQYRVIATSPIFLANLFIGCFAYAGMFAWIAGSPFVLQNLQGLSPFQFSICYAGSCAGFMVGGAIATRLVMRLGPYCGDRRCNTHARGCWHDCLHGAGALDAANADRLDGALSLRPGVRTCAGHGRRSHAVSEKRGCRVGADRLFAAIRRRHHGSGGR